jgi:Arc/MetJ-type ribon-helix-helix transcriptional regulator
MTEKQIQQMKDQIADSDEFVSPEDCETLIDISNNYNTENQYYCHEHKGRGGRKEKKRDFRGNHKKDHRLQIITVNIDVDQLEQLNRLLERGVYPSRSELIRIAMWKYLEHLRYIITAAKHASGNGARVKVEDGHEYIRIPVTADKFGNTVKKWVPILGQSNAYKHNKNNDNNDKKENINGNGPKRGAKRIRPANPHWEEVWNGSTWLNVPIPYEGKHNAEYIELNGVNVPIMRVKDFCQNNDLPHAITLQIQEIIAERRTDILVYKAKYEKSQTHTSTQQDHDQEQDPDPDEAVDTDNTDNSQKLEPSLHAT